MGKNPSLSFSIEKSQLVSYLHQIQKKEVGKSPIDKGEAEMMKNYKLSF